MPSSVSQPQPGIDFANLDLLPYGIIVVNGEGTIVYYNAREEEIAGKQREHVLGKNFFLDVAPCTQVAEFYGRFLETVKGEGPPARFSFRFPFKPQPRNVDITITSFRDQERPMCLISVRDVTEQERVRDRILHSERVREIGEVAATVAHNFNNVLMALKLHADLLSRDEALTIRSRKSVDLITKAVNDATEMTARILHSTRPVAKPVARLLVGDLIRDAVDFTRGYVADAPAERGARVELLHTVPSEPIAVEGNAGELREALINLIRNAADAISGKGTIQVTASVDGDTVAIEVADDGEGMSPEVQERLFRPLFTTKGTRGTGLGLASVYTIVRGHGGALSVWSEQGTGTKMGMLLPRAS